MSIDRSPGIHVGTSHGQGIEETKSSFDKLSETVENFARHG